MMIVPLASILSACRHLISKKARVTPISNVEPAGWRSRDPTLEEGIRDNPGKTKEEAEPEASSMVQTRAQCWERV